MTIKDIAKALNISVATVSRGIRNASDIRSETRNKILHFIEESNFHPSFIARSLVQKKTRIIGVIVPAINSHYFSQALSGMMDVATEQDYHLMICQSNENNLLENKSLDKLLACGIDGLLISVSEETVGTKALENVRNKNIPVVMFDRILPDFNCNKIIVNEYEGAFTAVEYLIRKGCKRIAHIGGPENLSISMQRKQGYLDALKTHKIPIYNKLIVHCSSFEVTALSVIHKLMKVVPHPDAIFCINDLSAITAIKYIRKKGFDVPHDVKVIGFNNDPISEVSDPAITTVMQPCYEVGKLSMGVLIDEIQKGVKDYTTLTLRSSLIKREST